MHHRYILSELNWMPAKKYPCKIDTVRFLFDSAHMEHNSEISEAKTVITSHQGPAVNWIPNYDPRIMHRKLLFRLGATKP